MPQPCPAAQEPRVRAVTDLPPQRGRAATAHGDGPWAGRFRPPLLPVLLLLTVLTRAPSLTRPVWNPDEGFLATQARRLAAGGTMYDTVVDRKPPLLPWLYEASLALFGEGTLLPMRVAAGAAVLTGAALVASLARRRWGSRTGYTAGVLYVLVHVGLAPEDTQAASFGVFMLPWTVAAVWCADRKRWLGAGLCAAGALLTKQTGGAVLAPVLLILWKYRGGWRALLRLLAGSAPPVVGTALLVGAGNFLYWNATGSGDYLSAEGSGMRALGRALAGTGVLTLACAPALAALAYAKAMRRPLPQSTDLWWWLGSSAAAAAVGLQFFGHYFLQLVPALALLGATGLSALSPRSATAGLALTGAVAAGFVFWALVTPRTELDHQRRLAAEVRARSAPDETVLLWGMHPEGYWLSGREPASRYLTAGFLTNFSGGRGTSRVGEEYAMPGAWAYFRGELRRRPPALLVDDSRGAPYGIARTPTLREWTERHCKRTAVVNGAVLYRFTG